MSPEPRFITDRMLGILTRYLRFMGYNTVSANSGFKEGNAKEDTLLLACAEREDRILLTRDTELARRGKERALLITSDEVMEQVQQLIDCGLIVRRLMMSRCSLCNTVLREATVREITCAEYAPQDKNGHHFWWCGECSKLYWNGSHGKHISNRLERELKGKNDKKGIK
jgi:uncharacterized protein with PIN domain